MNPTSKTAATPTDPHTFLSWNRAELQSCPAPQRPEAPAAVTLAGVDITLDSGLDHGPRLEVRGDEHAAQVRFDALRGDAGPLSLSVFSSRAQVGAQAETAAFLLRLSGDFEDGRWAGAGELYSVKAGAGTLNPDGSKGINLTAYATAGNLEGTWHGETVSVTGGLSLGGGLHASLGVRDRDGDNRLEGCFRAAVGPVTFGLCIEE